MNTENKSTTNPIEYRSGSYIAREVLGISRTSLWRASLLPGFPKAVRIGRSVRFEVAAVVAFVREGGAQ